jgi:hypothetical protein
MQGNRIFSVGGGWRDRSVGGSGVSHEDAGMVTWVVGDCGRGLCECVSGSRC